jgi:hypothetical protein
MLLPELPFIELKGALDGPDFFSCAAALETKAATYFPASSPRRWQ